MKRFQKNNESFICVNCGADVPEHPSSSRDHCNECLYSLHVDINPGDRANKCRGVLVPVSVYESNGKMQIEYRCKRCDETERNIVAPDDNKESVIAVSVQSEY